MAYKNFIPTVWSEAINRELEKELVYAEDCNRQYEGDVKQMGDTVRILGVGRPTITTQKGGDITLQNPEQVSDSSVSMKIDTVSYFNYMVGDIDKQQAVGGVLEALSKEATQGCADEMDMMLANLAKADGVKKLDASATTVSETNVLNYIDKGLQWLYGNNVKRTNRIVLTVPPWFYMILKRAYTALDTDNSKILENGNVGKYGNVIVKMTNNVAVDGSGNSLIQLKTDKAIAFANPMTHTEPYRPDNKFADAVKGFVLYGGKVVRPKEMVILNCKA